MKPTVIFVSLLILVSCGQHARSDFLGPSFARHAVSPDGFDQSKDSYIRRSGFELTGLSQLLYVSNAGDLIMISLCEGDCIRLYSKDGKLVKTWKLNEFLSKEEIEACAQTGATLQWLEEGAFSDRVFHFRGPSRQIRGLTPPYTVMRLPDEKVIFSASIHTATAELVKHNPQEP